MALIVIWILVQYIYVDHIRFSIDTQTLAKPLMMIQTYDHNTEYATKVILITNDIGYDLTRARSAGD